MQLVDTHCHIHEAAFTEGDDAATRSAWARFGDPDPNRLIAEAEQQGVGSMICVGTTLVDSRQAVSFVHGRPQCVASIGIHPHEAKDGIAALPALRQLLDESTKIVAIGECGLDYFYQHSSKDDQLKALRFQIELALEFDLPLIFHVREAFDDFWPIVDDYKGIRGVVHSYTDSQTNLQKLLERGLFVGVNGIATFTKSDDQLAMYRAIPLDRLLCETDAPFLTPTPLRGKMNVPANVRLVAEFMANLRGENLETLATRTTLSAQTLFNL